MIIYSKRQGQLLTVSILVGLFFLALTTLVVYGASSPARVTIATGSGGRNSLNPTINGDGSIIAFESDSDFLVKGVLDNDYQIWVYAAQSKVFTQVTTSSAVDRDSTLPSISADGRYVTFESDSDLVGQGIEDNQFEIWLYDVLTKVLTRVTTASIASERDSHNPFISRDGSKIYFESDSDFLGQAIPDDQFEIWAYDINTKSLSRLTSATHNERDSFRPSPSSDGKLVAFESDSDFLGQNIPDDQFEIWLFDTTTMTSTRVTVASGIGSRDSFKPSLSGNGTKVAFQSDSSFQGQGIPNEQFEVWVYDIASQTYQRISPIAGSGDRDSFDASMNVDGTMVAFESDSDFLGQNIPDDQFEIWSFNLNTLNLSRVSTGIPLNEGRDSLNATMNQEGNKIIFQSDSDFANTNIPAGQNEIWLFSTVNVYLPMVIKN